MRYFQNFTPPSTDMFLRPNFRFIQPRILFNSLGSKPVQVPPPEVDRDLLTCDELTCKNFVMLQFSTFTARANMDVKVPSRREPHNRILYRCGN